MYQKLCPIATLVACRGNIIFMKICSAMTAIESRVSAIQVLEFQHTVKGKTRLKLSGFL